MDNIGKGYETWWRDHREWLESFGYKLRRDLQVIPQEVLSDQKRGRLQFVRVSAVGVFWTDQSILNSESKYVNGRYAHSGWKTRHVEEG